MAPSFRIILSFLPLFLVRSFLCDSLLRSLLSIQESRNSRGGKISRSLLLFHRSMSNVRLACFILPGLRSTLSFVLSSRPSLISGYSPSSLLLSFNPLRPLCRYRALFQIGARAVWLVETFDGFVFIPPSCSQTIIIRDESSALNSRRHVIVDSRASPSLSFTLVHVSRRARRTMYGSRLRTIRCIGVSVNSSLAAKCN